MKQGYLTSVMLYDDERFQMDNAIALSISIKIHNPEANVSIMVNNKDLVSENDCKYFDQVVETPFGVNQDLRSNDWQLYWATPYDQTIYIDPHCLVAKDLSGLFEYFSNSYSLGLITQDYTFNGKPYKTTDGFYQVTDVTPVCPWIFYFDKGDEALQFFKLCDPLMQNWRAAQDNFVKDKQHIRKYYDPQLMLSLVAYSMVDPENYYVNNTPVRVTNMQWINDIIDANWIEKINYWVNPNNKIKIQNFFVQDMLYYQDREFLTVEIYEQIKQQYREQQLKTAVVG